MKEDSGLKGYAQFAITLIVLVGGGYLLWLMIEQLTPVEIIAMMMLALNFWFRAVDAANTARVAGSAASEAITRILAEQGFAGARPVERGTIGLMETHDAR